jgi:radical SAM superfamily enzyme YgiQ (UPF0313 family)
MKVALINPPITIKERYGTDIGDIGGHQAPLGILCLASSLEKHGVEVHVVDGEFEALSTLDVVARIEQIDPDLVGLTSTTVAFKNAIKLGQAIKKCCGNVPVVIGGCHVTANQKEALSHLCFDYGVIGEGEKTLLELARAISEKEDVSGIKGLVYRKSEDNHIVETPRRPYIDNLDELPLPAYHLLKSIESYHPPLGCYRYRPVFSMITTRGCPHRCIFCDNSVFGRTIRYHSAEYVLSEIEVLIHKHGAREIAFVDDTFTVNRARLQNILNLIRKAHLQFTWTCMARVDTLDYELLKLMKDTGCWQISVGIESGDQKILNDIKKGIRIDQVQNVVNWGHSLGIAMKGFFMVGHLTDTTESIAKTISFANSIPLTDVVVTIATPMKGSEFYALAKKYGELRMSDYASFSYWEPVFVPKGLTGQRLLDAQRVFYKRFYARLPVLFRQLKKIKRVSTLMTLLSHALKVARQAKKQVHYQENPQAVR